MPTYEELVAAAMGGFQPYLSGGMNDQGLTPYMQASIQNYERNILPAIQNQYALIGLGSSPAMAEGVAAGYYSMLPQALQLQQQAQIAAAQGAGTLAGIDTQRYGIDQNTALGYAGLDTQRYGIDTDAATRRYLGELQNQLGYAGLDVQRYGIDQNTALGYAGLDTQRYGIDQQSAAQAAMRELQAQQIALQGELGFGTLANQASQNELMQRQLALQGYGLAGQLQQNQYQMELDAYYNEMMRLQNLGIFALSGGFGAPVGNQTTQSSSGGGCFITTAICDLLGKPDDCDELQALRRFRDRHVKPQHGGLVAQYYALAPRILKRLKQDGGMEDALMGAYHRFMKPIHRMLSRGETHGVYVAYCSMVQHLMRRTGVELAR